MIDVIEGDGLIERLLARGPSDLEARCNLHRFVAQHGDVLRMPRAAAAEAASPKIYVYWAQGFDQAPPIVKACHRQLLATHDPELIVALTDANISSVADVPGFVFDRLATNKTHFSDVLRIILLADVGGIWADATCFVVRDIAKWFSAAVGNSGFFAYSRYDNYLLSNWFMMAQPFHVITSFMRDMLLEYWKIRTDLEHYFLFHFLFEALYNQCALFREQWDRVIQESSEIAHRLQTKLREPADVDELRIILSSSAVHKLTYKLADVPKNSMFELLCERGAFLREPRAEPDGMMR